MNYLKIVQYSAGKNKGGDLSFFQIIGGFDEIALPKKYERVYNENRKSWVSSTGGIGMDFAVFTTL